jgi:WD40 repeat protein
VSDVFISYSRLDKDFVGKLRDGLAEQEQDVWIDWESIPPSQAWWNEIQKGIAKANNFVVVLSPNSMASPICQMEIEYARQLGKRIIPVSHLPFERKDAIKAMAGRLADDNQEATRTIWGNRQPHSLFDANDSVLKHINYFFFGPEDDFETRFMALFEVIRTDFDYKEQHTMLELRALEWQRRHHNASFLLLDDELTGAQSWLAQAESKAPSPTELQRAYIQASEKRTRQLRNIRRASIVGSAVAIIATVFAIGASLLGTRATNTANSANTQVANLETTSIPATFNAVSTEVEVRVQAGEARIESLRLAALASDELNAENGNPETAALLGIRALNTAYTAQADAALVSALDRSFILQGFEGHMGGVSSVAFSPDGQRALSGSHDNTLRLWDVATGETLRVFEGHTDSVTSVTFSPDGQRALSASWDGTLRLWDTNTGETLRVFTGHTDGVEHVAFSPDEQRALSGSRDSTLRLWDVDTGATLRVFTGHTSMVSSVAFSPDGQRALSGSTDGTLRLWSASMNTSTSAAATEETLRVFEGHTGFVLSVVFSPDGQRALSASRDSTLRLWDVATGVTLLIFEGHTGEVGSVAFSPDGKYALSASGDIDGNDNTLRLWNVNTGDILRVFEGHTGFVSSVTFSPDGQRALSGSGDGTLRLWSGVAIPALNPATDETGEVPRVFTGHTSIVSSVAFSPDGQRALSASWDGTLRLWDVATGETLRVLVGHTHHISDVAFSPDGQRALSGSHDTTLRLWDIATGETLRVFEGHTDWVSSVAFSPDGQHALSGSGDRTLRLWDVATGDTLRAFEGHTDGVSSVAFSLDGQHALSGSDDRTLRLWDVATGEALRVLVGHTLPISDVAFSPDGQRALSGSFDNTLWDVKTGVTLRVFTGHTDGVSSVAFSPDGRSILSGAFDNTLRLWEVATGETLRVLQGHTGFVLSVAFSPDGQRALSGSEDNTLRLWDTNYHDFTLFACTRVFRDFTDEERQQFGITNDEPTCPKFA